MKSLVIIAMFFLSLVGALGIVGFLMYKGVSGWGWLLFAVILLFGSLSIKVD